MALARVEIIQYKIIDNRKCVQYSDFKEVSIGNDHIDDFIENPELLSPHISQLFPSGVLKKYNKSKIHIKIYVPPIHQSDDIWIAPHKEPIISLKI